MKGIEFIFLAFGATAGAFIRFKILESTLILGSIPLNVLIVNVFGSFILGLFIVVSQFWNIEEKYFLLVAIGFCGSLTTMSSFALDSSNLLDSNNYTALFIHILANVGLSIGALIAGKEIMNSILN